MTQQTLFRARPKPKLTDRQALVLEEVRRRPEGILDADMGALLHARLRKHEPAERCDYCAHDGRHALVALRDRGLVRQARSTKRWHPARGHRRLVEYGPEAEQHPAPGTDIPF